MANPLHFGGCSTLSHDGVQPTVLSHLTSGMRAAKARSRTVGCMQEKENLEDQIDQWFNRFYSDMAKMVLVTMLFEAALLITLVITGHGTLTRPRARLAIAPIWLFSVCGLCRANIGSRRWRKYTQSSGLMCPIGESDASDK